MARPQLDHIIILVPQSTLRNPPAWLASNFTITPGGRHGDGITENVLISFQDGVYIELIAFVDGIDSTERARHWWGNKTPGIIDFALTSTSVEDLESTRQRVSTAGALNGVEYTQPRAGGRDKPDGTTIKWQVTFPHGGNVGRGAIPFWCHDVTARELRVPGSAKATQHSSGAMGILGLTLEVPETKFEETVRFYQAVFDGPGVAHGTNEVAIDCDPPITLSPGSKTPQITLRSSESGSAEIRSITMGVAGANDPAQEIHVSFEGGAEFDLRFEQLMSS